MNFRKYFKKPKSQFLIAIIMVAVVFCIIILAQIISKSNFNKNKTGSANFNFSASDKASNFANQMDSNSIESVANRVSQSVVSIVSKNQKSSRFFYSTEDSASAGTGIIISENGYILTNKHVIEKSSEILVITNSGDSYESVRVVMVDPMSDIAILKISNAKGLKAAELGDSKKINIGQQVIAIGNALGEYDGTVTSGIISGIGRTVEASSEDGSSREVLTDMIQTDAAINSGNSGGPLVNAQGQVIGINTAVASKAQSIGFAIPISSVKGVLKSISEGKEPKRAYLGASYISINPQIRKKYNLDVSKGALVKSKKGNAIVYGSPAQKAGLKDGDIITKIDGVEVSKNSSVSSLIGERSVDDTVEISYIRDGREKNTRATLEEYHK